MMTFFNYDKQIYLGDIDVQQPLIDVFAEADSFVIAPPDEFEVCCY